MFTTLLEIEIRKQKDVARRTFEETEENFEKRQTITHQSSRTLRNTSQPLQILKVMMTFNQ